jgi:hypothetical protein
MLRVKMAVKWIGNHVNASAKIKDIPEQIAVLAQNVHAMDMVFLIRKLVHVYVKFHFS